MDDNYVATVENVDTSSIALQNMTITIGKTDCHLLLDSGSGCTIINMSLAREVMLNCAQSQWSEKNPLELKSFSNNIVETLGTLKTPVRCNDWKNQKTKITVVADGFRPIPGRDLFDQLGIKISQKPCPNIEINNLETPCAIKKTAYKGISCSNLTNRKTEKSYSQFEISQNLSSHASKREKSANSSPTKSKN